MKRFIQQIDSKNIKFYRRIIIAVFILSLLCFYLSEKISSLRSQLAKDQSYAFSFNKLNADIIKARTIRNRMALRKATLLLTRIGQEAKSGSWKHYPANIQKKGIDQIEITFMRITSEDLINGLERLTAVSDIQTQQIIIKRLGDTPFVYADLVLQIS